MGPDICHPEAQSDREQQESKVRNQTVIVLAGRGSGCCSYKPALRHLLVVSEQVCSRVIAKRPTFVFFFFLCACHRGKFSGISIERRICCLCTSFAHEADNQRREKRRENIRPISATDLRTFRICNECQWSIFHSVLLACLYLWEYFLCNLALCC